MTKRTAPGTHKYQRILIPTVLMLSLALGLSGLSTPAGASTIIIDDSKYLSNNYNYPIDSTTLNKHLGYVGFKNASDLRAPFTIVAFGNITTTPGVYAGNYPVVLKYKNNIVGNGTESFQIFPNSPESSYVVLTVDDFNSALVLDTYAVLMQGAAPLLFHTGGTGRFVYNAINPPHAYAGFGYNYEYNYYRYGGAYTLNVESEYKTCIEYIEEGSESFIIDNISQNRIIDGESYPAYSVLNGKSGEEYWNSTGVTPLNAKISANERPYTLTIYSEVLDRWYTYTLYESIDTQPTVEPCTINVYDSDSRLPLSGAWDYYVVVQGADAVSGSASGAFTVVNLPVTSILKPHLLYVTKEGYEMTPGFVAIDVPAGGREIKIYLTPLETTAPDNSSVVTFSVTDIESGAPVHSALVNVDGVAKYVGASGTAWFILPENTSHDWVVSSPNHWPIGGNFTLGVDDLAIPVSLTRKTSDLPRPPLPDLPNFPVIHPSLDPAGFRMQILSVPLLGSLASPLLDTVDSLGVGLNDMATTVLDVLTMPADEITGAVSSVGQNLIDTATPYLVTSSLLLQVIGAVISCIPEQVCGLVTFGLLLDIVRILLWGSA